MRSARIVLTVLNLLNDGQIESRIHREVSVRLAEGVPPKPQAEKACMARRRLPYKGPFAKTGANLHLWECGIIPLPEGKKAAAIICYEAFLTWPFLVSMTQKPDVIISTANLWWCKNTSLPDTQKVIVSLWSLLFGVPAVFARNI